MVSSHSFARVISICASEMAKEVLEEGASDGAAGSRVPHDLNRDGEVQVMGC